VLITRASPFIVWLIHIIQGLVFLWSTGFGAVSAIQGSSQLVFLRYG